MDPAGSAEPQDKVAALIEQRELFEKMTSQ